MMTEDLQHIKQILEEEINWESAFENTGELIKHDKELDIRYYEFLELEKGKLVLADEYTHQIEGDKSFTIYYTCIGPKVNIALGFVNENNGFVLDEDELEEWLELGDVAYALLDDMDFVMGDN